MPDTDPSFYVTLKFQKGALDTTDGRSGYRYKPGARMYPTKQPASAMRRRWLGEGYDVRLARVWIDEDGQPHIEYCDQDDNIKPVCRATRTRQRSYPPGTTYVDRLCVLDADHGGRHCTTRQRTRYNEFDADGETS
ncbi:hypothetical protein MYRNA_194 [Mycobacterium phage Myrna]|uniref:Uncharacterized protein n=1 Tax=Mycobacterium phage Myrna TaxID=546805 RepID=B5LJG6_9CAUD|nr:gp194 [Mycobacterium phage Myrna]ACH62163.1 hypothetical protein MYRNA_194 [Mycobacterium phage Myrna]